MMKYNKNKEEKTIFQLEIIPGSRRIIMRCIGFAFSLLVIGLLLYLSSGSIDKAHGYIESAAESQLSFASAIRKEAVRIYSEPGV